MTHVLNHHVVYYVILLSAASRNDKAAICADGGPWQNRQHWRSLLHVPHDASLDAGKIKPGVAPRWHRGVHGAR